MNISWPLQSADGDWILYLVETPFVKYNTAGREVHEECDIDPKLVNSLNLGLDRQTRQSRDYDLGTGSMFDSYGNNEEESDYNYDHLMASIIDSSEVDEIEGRKSILEPTISEDLSVLKAAMPESERVMQKPIEAPSYVGERFGRVSFFCRVNLAVNEIGVVHVTSRLHQQSVGSKYEGVSKFSIESNAAMLENEFVKARDNSSVEVKTTLEVRNPVMNQGINMHILYILLIIWL